VTALRVAIVHPPVTVARDFIDYPYHADLGAVAAAAAVRAAGHEVHAIDAYALPGAGLTWRADGRAHLGASVDDVIAAVAAVGPPRRDRPRVHAVSPAAPPR
jgi:hypothetical protein